MNIAMPPRSLSTHRSRRRGYLLVAPWEIFGAGGVAKAIASLGAALDRTGVWEVHYLELSGSNGEKTSRDGHRVFQKKVRPLPTASVPLLSRLVFLVTLVPAASSMLAHLYRWRIEVVNVHYPTPEAWLFSALRKLRLYRGQLVLSVHGLDIRETLRHENLAGAMRWVYESADAIVACSHSLARDVSLLSPMVAERTQTVHNGLEPDPVPPEGHPKQSGSASRNLAFGNAAHQPTVLSVATFESKKGLDVLVESFAICRQTCPTLRLRIIGQLHKQSSIFKEVVGQVSALGITDCVDVATDVPNDAVLTAVAAADVFVLPSRREPFGLVLLEAGQVGTPIVATNVDGIPEVVPSDDYGLLVEPDDVQGLSRAILDVLHNPSAAYRRAANMQRRVRETFTSDATAEKYTAIVAGCSADRLC